MKIRWGKLAGQLGILYCLAGLVLVFLGWNGAATYDRVSAQVPYVISGGLAGLCLVVIGGSVLVAASAREGSAALQATVEELRAAVERMGGGEATPGASAGAGAPAGDEMVVAGPSSYHRPTCRMVQGQAGTTMTTASVAAARDLAACRICAPDTAAPAAGGDTAATVPGSTSASARR
jgi:hypothetical protein